MPAKTVLVNRAPVLTLWAAIVAERLGYRRGTALTLGKAVAGLDAQSKGRRLGLYPKRGAEVATHKAKKPSKAPSKTVVLLGRAVPVAKTKDGLRAVVKDRVESPASVERYLEEKFGKALSDSRTAMRALAKAHPPRKLEEIAFSLYEQFRPKIPGGAKGWGAKGRLDLNRIRALARRTG